ncbi:hypothetical protein [Aerosakkonema funiforme]|uniref:hypothetical protein n=1 Tax=Aerosakkonema funiforme TaxID=1246630 RepID=UPI0035BB67CC
MNFDDGKIGDVSRSVIIPMTEAEYAQKLRARGINIVCHQERYWKEIVLGFYEPVHLMARLTSEQATRPALLSWGFRTALDEKDRATANAIMPINLLSELENYDPENLPRKRRADLRKSMKQVRIVELIDGSILQQQGYEVLCSSLQRTKHDKIPTKANYLATIAAESADRHCLTIGGMIGNKLGGYITGWAVDGTAYMVKGYYATEALPTSIVTGLYYGFIQVCKRSGKIHQIANSQHLKELPNLCFYKESMKFLVHFIPTKLSMNPVMKQLIRWRYPNKYYRLSGQYRS